MLSIPHYQVPPLSSFGKRVFKNHRTPLAKSAALRRAIALDGVLVRRSPMSLLQQPVPPVPDDTARIARAAFPRGNPYVLLRDRLGPVFDNAGFADLYA